MPTTLEAAQANAWIDSLACARKTCLSLQYQEEKLQNDYVPDEVLQKVREYRELLGKEMQECKRNLLEITHIAPHAKEASEMIGDGLQNAAVSFLTMKRMRELIYTNSPTSVILAAEEVKLQTPIPAIAIERDPSLRFKHLPQVMDIEEACGDEKNPITLQGYFLEKEMRKECQKRNHVAEMGMMGENVLGYALCQLYPDHLAVVRLNVDPQYRHRGIGTQLVQLMINRLNKRRNRLLMDIHEYDEESIQFAEAVDLPMRRTVEKEFGHMAYQVEYEHSETENTKKGNRLARISSRL